MENERWVKKDFYPGKERTELFCVTIGTTGEFYKEMKDRGNFTPNVVTGVRTCWVTVD